MSRIAVIVAVGMAIGMLMLAVLAVMLIAYPLSNLDSPALKQSYVQLGGSAQNVAPEATGIPIPPAPDKGTVLTGVPVGQPGTVGAAAP